MSGPESGENPSSGTDIKPAISTAIAPDNLADIVIDRLGTPTDQAQPKRDYFTNLAPQVLELMTGLIDVPFPSRWINQELVYFNDRNYRAYPDYYPIISLGSATQWGSTSPWKVGTLQALSQGQCDIAIGPKLDCFRLNNNACFPVEVFCTYQAGYDSLPSDLVNVFVELCLLIQQEQKRVGKTMEKIDVMQTTYTRKLSDQSQSELWRYRRANLYIS